MTREEIVEELAESIYQYSSCLDEMKPNTDYLLQAIDAEVRIAVDKKIDSRRIKLWKNTTKK